jgi:hypothetical protein
MTADAISLVTKVLQDRLSAAIGGPVYVGPPVGKDVGGDRLALFLFHLVPNADLRNAKHYVPPSNDSDEPLVEVEALPLDLRYLLSAFRSAGAGNGGLADPDELLTLGQAIRALHAQPMIDGSHVPDQLARISPEPYPMEEMSRVWGLFPDTSYRTSMVYLVTPVSVSLDPPLVGQRVLERTFRQGVLTGPGTTRAEP